MPKMCVIKTRNICAIYIKKKKHHLKEKHKKKKHKDVQYHIIEVNTLYLNENKHIQDDGREKHKLDGTREP